MPTMTEKRRSPKGTKAIIASLTDDTTVIPSTSKSRTHTKRRKAVEAGPSAEEVAAHMSTDAPVTDEHLKTLTTWGKNGGSSLDIPTQKKRTQRRFYQGEVSPTIFTRQFRETVELFKLMRAIPQLFRFNRHSLQMMAGLVAAATDILGRIQQADGRRVSKPALQWAMGIAVGVYNYYYADAIQSFGQSPSWLATSLRNIDEKAPGLIVGDIIDKLGELSKALQAAIGYDTAEAAQVATQDKKGLPKRSLVDIQAMAAAYKPYQALVQELQTKAKIVEQTQAEAAELAEQGAVGDELAGILDELVDLREELGLDV